MATKSWTVAVNGRNHIVDLDHRYMSGHREIRVDGTPIPLPERGKLSWVDSGGEYSFFVGEQPATVLIQSSGVAFSYDLVLNGRSLTTGREVRQVDFPAWGWIFVAACAAIPFLAVGGVVPVLLGFSGAMACRRIGMDGMRTEGARMMRCAGVTLACWASSVVFLLTLGAML